MSQSRLVYVEYKVAAFNIDLRFGFRTTVKESTSTACGHKLVSELADAQHLVIGANSPKPQRASKRTAAGYESSYIATSKVTAAKKAGWKIQKGKPARSARKTPLSSPHYVTINGVKYAFPMRTKQVTALAANLELLGIKPATATDLDLVWGASFPKPAHAIRPSTADGIDSVSCFVDDGKVDNLPEGFLLQSLGKNLVNQI